MKTLKTLLAVLVIASITAGATQSKEFTVTGTVTDGQNRPLHGATVQNPATKTAVLTGADGKYSIKATAGDELTFSFIGYQTATQEVKGATLNVRLVADDSQLEEVAVLGYGTDAKRLTRHKAVGMADMASFVSSPMPRMEAEYYPGGKEYAHVRENRFVNVGKDALSTFALEVDGASYSNARRMINRGQLPEKDAVRVEEFINYFSYDYEKPTGKDPLKVNYEVGACPWNPAHRLVRIGVKAREIASGNLPNSNFVFLIDVSGSMYGSDRLPLVVASLKLLTNNLRPEDRVAIVTYASGTRVALPSTPGSNRQKIREVLDGLTAGGSTAGAAGLTLAYEIARKNFIEGGNNRIILATDGDFNVGASSDEAMETLIERERKTGVFLTVLGYGMGNYKDKKIQTLAEKGNGNHAYIDNLQEANKVLVSEFGGTMYAVAKDVKLQVEFNPARVASFRLVGYESRLLAHEDFNDDTKDAGEIGAGHTVTALYEIVPTGSDSQTGSIDPLKYQPMMDKIAPAPYYSNELMTVKIRYKQPDGDVSEKMEIPIVDRGGKQSAGFRFVSAVAMFAQLLRDSDFKGDATWEKVISEAHAGLSDDPNGYRHELVRLAETVKGLKK